MFITDKLVYLQLQKTASTHIARLIEHTVGGVHSGKHNRLGECGTTRYVVGSIRNPWEWYVSLWAFGCKKRGAVYHHTTSRFRRPLLLMIHADAEALSRPRPLRRQAADWLLTGIRKPVRQWRKVYASIENTYHFRTWLKMVLDDRRSKEVNQDYGASGIGPVAGLLTFRYLWLHSRDLGSVFDPRNSTVDALLRTDATNNLLNGVIRNENLENGCIDHLQRCGYSLSRADASWINAQKNNKLNKSKHLKVNTYYDNETSDLVLRKERFIVAKYGYTPP